MFFRSVSDLAVSSGLSRSSLLDLLAKAPALASLEVSGLLPGLEQLSGLLEVTLADVLALVAQQPTLLLAKVNSKAFAIFVLSIP